MKKTKKKYKSYYVPVSERKTTKVAKKASKKTPSKVAKKKYKSYYKPKKKVVHDSALIPPKNVKVLSEKELDAEFAKYPVAKIAKPKAVPVSSLPKDVIPNKRPVKYLNNRDLLAQVVASKARMSMTNDLAKMLQLLTSRYAKKGNFANYTYNDDMQSYAMLMLVKTWNSFDPAKSSNPFAFFTQCIKNSFIQYLNYEKRQRDIRDEKLVDMGMNPSFGFTYDYEEKQREAEPADQEVMEAPTKLHEDVDTFNDVQDSDLPDAPDHGTDHAY